MFRIPFKYNQIYHMASMARSGETLLLKMLGAHSQVKIVHNLQVEDDNNENRAFEFLKTYAKTRIRRNHKLFRHYNLKSNDILLIKQGVWQHSFPFIGFVLARNPVSIFSSLKAYDKDTIGYDPKRNFWSKNEKRLLRWSKDISKNLYNELLKKEPIEQFVIFYNYRMLSLLKLNIPIIRYEDLITNTEREIIGLCNILKIDFHEDMVYAHKQYPKGTIGHGKNDLSQPVDKSTLDKYRKNVSLEEFNYIARHAYKVYKQFGYQLADYAIKVLEYENH